jgi:hypothetical protein
MWTFFRDLERDELRRGRCYFERHCHGELRSYGLGFSDLVGLQSSKKLDGRTDQGSWFGQQLCDGHSQARTQLFVLVCENRTVGLIDVQCNAARSRGLAQSPLSLTLRWLPPFSER